MGTNSWIDHPFSRLRSPARGSERTKSATCQPPVLPAAMRLGSLLKTRIKVTQGVSLSGISAGGLLSQSGQNLFSAIARCESGNRAGRSSRLKYPSFHSRPSASCCDCNLHEEIQAGIPVYHMRDWLRGEPGLVRSSSFCLAG